MKYNKEYVRVPTKKIVQVDKKELAKGRKGKDFIVNVIKYSKLKPEPPVGPNDGNDVIKPPEAPAWFRAFEERNNSRLDRIETTLKQHGESIAGIQTDIGDLKSRVSALDTKLTNVITLNNLKS